MDTDTRAVEACPGGWEQLGGSIGENGDIYNTQTIKKPIFIKKDTELFHKHKENFL